MNDPYVYPGTDILVNKYGIRDKQTLNNMEAEATSYRMKQLLGSPIKGDFSFDHLTQINKFIFQDAYSWAGKTRGVNIEKEEPALGGISIEYAKVGDIQKEAVAIILKMHDTKWEELDLDSKAEKFSTYMVELWKAHPFREGNTRTIVTFCCQYADSKGMPLDMALFKENAIYLRTALVAASAYFHDMGDMSQPQHLIKIVKHAMENGKEKLKEQRKTIDQWKSDSQQMRDGRLAELKSYDNRDKEK